MTSEDDQASFIFIGIGPPVARYRVGGEDSPPGQHRPYCTVVEADEQLWIIWYPSGEPVQSSQTVLGYATNPIDEALPLPNAQ
jgi:hypothetical protein